MFRNLIEDANKEGFNEIVVEVIVKSSSGKIFLIHEQKSLLANYQLPSCLLRLNETIPQAIVRAVVEKMAMTLKEVIAYLCHRDVEGKRYFTFIASVDCPSLVEGSRNISSAWVNIEEAYGYPISEDVRETLDLYTRFEESSR